MRGLNVRVQYALAQIAVLAGTPDAKLLRGAVVFQALQDGHGDFRNQTVNPPIMFSDVPELLNSWRRGQDQGVHEARTRTRITMIMIFLIERKYEQ